jgi:hypothetical protein
VKVLSPVNVKMCNLYARVQLEAVLRRILRLKSEDPEMKVLLFSEWAGVLDVVEHALTTNHITYARVKNPGCVSVSCSPSVVIYYIREAVNRVDLLVMIPEESCECPRSFLLENVKYVQISFERLNGKY